MEIVQFLKELVLEAGDISLEYFGKVKAYEKHDRSLVTEADMALDRFITEKIRNKYPSHYILSEEANKENKDLINGYLWAIDPIDGTASFAAGLPIWGISAGIIIGDFPVMGAFYIPVTKELYYSDGNDSYLWERKLDKIEKTTINRHSCLFVPSYCHKNMDLRTFPGKTRSMGSIAAHLCYVAGGSALGCIMEGHIWDIAAGDAILRTAGGRIRYADRTELNWKELCLCNKTSKFCIASGDDNFQILSELEIS